MQTTKNQHYVPRFYLKPFSSIKNANRRNEKALISFFQFDDDLQKQHVPTTSVCSERFFYDKDGTIENYLAQKESVWANVFSKVNNGELLDFSETAHVREFAAFQLCRTQAMLIHNQSMAREIRTGVAANSARSASSMSQLDSVAEKTTSTEITPKMCLSFVDDFMSTTTDLEINWIDNGSETPFITSDAPVIIINPLGITRAGLGDVGTTVFFPISPRKMIMLYDQKLFGTMTREIRDSRCVDVLNGYQYVAGQKRILSQNTADFSRYLGDKTLQIARNKFCTTSAALTVPYKGGTFIAAKSRSIPYDFPIPLLRLPRRLTKIPADYRETFPRTYSRESRIAILCRIYNSFASVSAPNIRQHFERGRKPYKRLLDFFDSYWETPGEDRVISGPLMNQLKNTPLEFISIPNASSSVLNR